MREILTLPLSPDVDHCETFERSFDFSKFPNLQEVGFGAGWVGGSLLWIHAALSTLRPATSPRLSTIQLNFTCAPTSDRSVEAVIECVGNDLRRIADEVTRIEHEFKGAVKVIVLQDPWFKPALDSLNVKSRFCGASRILADSLLFTPCRSQCNVEIIQ